MASKKLVKKTKAATKTVGAKVKKATPIVKSKALTSKPAAKAIGKITKPLTKSELYSIIAESVEIKRQQVSAVFDKLSEVIAIHLKKDGPEQFTLPGLLKVKVKKVPARPARKGKNPFTGEMMIFTAKPASKKIKIIALRSLKEMC